MILVVTEQRDGVIGRESREAIAAARVLAKGEPSPGPLVAALPGAPGPGIAAAARELSGRAVDEVVTIESSALDVYTADGYVLALEQAIHALEPRFVVFPHTYRARDFVPALAARLDRAIVSDVTAITRGEDGPGFVRPLFQGRLAATVVPEGPPPFFVSVQAGAFREDGLEHAGSAPVRRLEPVVDASRIRQRPEPPVKEVKESVDLARAERIVAVGRGIREERHVALARDLARRLGAELAASRPVCDSGWLSMDRQVGSSGQVVAPRLYLAIGISGAIQHVVGMKGSGVVVAINKDPEAPIFEIADYGIAADLFDVVPELIKALEEPGR